MVNLTYGQRLILQEGKELAELRAKTFADIEERARLERALFDNAETKPWVAKADYALIPKKRVGETLGIKDHNTLTRLYPEESDAVESRR